MSNNIAYADQDTLVDYASEYPNFAECRDLGHGWQREGAGKHVVPKGARIINVRPRGSLDEVRCCFRCGAQKIYALDRTFARLDLPPKMKYPDGYLLPKGSGFIGREQRDNLRKAHFGILRRRKVRTKTGQPNLSVVKTQARKSA